MELNLEPYQVSVCFLLQRVSLMIDMLFFFLLTCHTLMMLLGNMPDSIFFFLSPFYVHAHYADDSYYVVVQLNIIR